MTTPEQSGTESEDFESTDANLDELFAVLSNPRRRFLLAFLDERAEPMALADVAAELARWECDAPTDQIPDERVVSRYLTLHHVHIPKMVDAGLIERDQDRNTIELKDEYLGIATTDKPVLSNLCALRKIL